MAPVLSVAGLGPYFLGVYMYVSLKCYGETIAKYLIKDGGQIEEIHLDDAYRPRFEDAFERGQEYVPGSILFPFKVASDAKPVDILKQVFRNLAASQKMELTWFEDIKIYTIDELRELQDAYFLRNGN